MLNYEAQEKLQNKVLNATILLSTFFYYDYFKFNETLVLLEITIYYKFYYKTSANL